MGVDLALRLAILHRVAGLQQEDRHRIRSVDRAPVGLGLERLEGLGLGIEARQVERVVGLAPVLDLHAIEAREAHGDAMLAAVAQEQQIELPLVDALALFLRRLEGRVIAGVGGQVLDQARRMELQHPARLELVHAGAHALDEDHFLLGVERDLVLGDDVGHADPRVSPRPT